MPDIPYPFNPRTLEEAIAQIKRIFDEFSNDRLAGATVGDVFQINNETDELTLTVDTTGGLQKTTDGLSILPDPDGPMSTSADGLDITVVSTAMKGAAPTLSNVVTQFLNGQGGWTVPAGSYTDENAQDAVGAMIGDSLVYVDGTPELDVIQDVRTSASPTFVTAKLTGLTDGYVPKHTSDAVGLADSLLFQGTTGIGIGMAAPTAVLHLKVGTTAASTAPLKFTVAGTALLTTAEVGVLEPFTDDLYYTITTGAARKGLVMNDGFPLTATRVPFCTTNGRLTDDAGLTYVSATTVLNLMDYGTNSLPGFVITAYNDQVTYEPYFTFQKSHTDTINTLVETIDTEELGIINFQGVNSTPGAAPGFSIRVVQNGASGAGLVPANAYFETRTVAGTNTNQLVLYADGNVGIGIAIPLYTLDITGNLRCSTGFGCNGKTPQTAYSCAAWDEPGAGAFGVDSAAHMAALVELVQDIQAALIANGIMASA